MTAVKKSNAKKNVPQEAKVSGVISFFSGCGLLDLGFEDSNFEVMFVNEIQKEFVSAYQYSRAQLKYVAPKFGCSTESIDYFLDSKGKKELAAIVGESRKDGIPVGFIGGPPCPDFSVAGKNRGSTGDNGRLSQSYIDLICDQKPDWFLFENVRGLWRTKTHRAFFEKLKKQLEKAGYSLTEKLLNSLQFGVPQDRDRIFLFGTLKKLNLETSTTFKWEVAAPFTREQAFGFPWPMTDSFGSKPPKAKVPDELTVLHWFKRNAVEQHPNSVHCFQARAGLAKFMVIAEGDSSRKSYKRLHRYRYSPTVAYGNNEVHLHPWLPRRLTVAEALSLQSLPKAYVLPPDMTLSAMFKTIGNGVPYLLGKGVAFAVAAHLSQEKA
jgi:DNA (cytosine-5)-methyltransferase 1